MAMVVRRMHAILQLERSHRVLYQVLTRVRGRKFQYQAHAFAMTCILEVVVIQAPVTLEYNHAATRACSEMAAPLTAATCPLETAAHKAALSQACDGRMQVHCLTMRHVVHHQR